MIAFFANLFGYVLNFLYGFVGNYGIAIILFSVLIKIIMIPISISQQKTMKKSQKVNAEMKQIQFKYKNDPEKMNQEVMELYKREKMSPFSGCFSAIIQIILLFSVFYLVRSPLTYMKKVDKQIIEKSIAVVLENGGTSNYKEIAVINYINKLQNQEPVREEEQENSEEIKEQEEQENQTENKEESINKNKPEETSNQEFDITEYKDELYINMNLLGIDLSKVPTEDLRNIKALIIPILYVISSFISIRLSTNLTNKKKNQEKLISDGSEKEEKEDEKKEQDLNEAMEDTNRKMAWFMPIMSISIAMVAPLGLALYWLMNNILMIFERLVLNKIIKE